MYCKHCGKEIAEDAKFCPGCGKRTDEKSAPVFHVDPEAEKKHRKRGCLTWLVAGILLFGGCVAIFGDSDTPSPSEPETQSTTAPTGKPTTAPTEEPVIEITPSELYNAYEENEVAADNQYKGKLVRITGTIDNIGKDILDEVYITIEAGNTFDSIQCYFENEEQIEKVATLKSGEEITLVGECTGLTITTVMMHSCEIE